MIKQRVSKVFLRLLRWEVVGELPDIPKFVMLASPHTTNWDLPSLLMATWNDGRNVQWLGKHQLFRGPMNPLMRALGGLPVRRGAPGGMVEALRREFADADTMALTIPAEGTRAFSDHWKSGFYRLAIAADVPIVCSYVDYSTRTLGFGPVMTPTGDVDADLAFFRAFYADKRGKFPDQESSIQFRE